MSRDIARQAIRIQNVARTGKLTLPSDETQNVQHMQIYLNQYESLDNLNSMQLYGFASASPKGTDAVCLLLNGDRSNGCVIATNHNELRPIGMKEGETQIYDSKGQKIYLQQASDGLVINISAGQKVKITADTEVDITAPNVVINGNLKVNGTIVATGNVTGGSIDLIHHVHINGGGTGNSGQPTG